MADSWGKAMGQGQLRLSSWCCFRVPALGLHVALSRSITGVITSWLDAKGLVTLFQLESVFCMYNETAHRTK